MSDRVKGSLEGCDGNAFSLMRHFRNLAKRQGFNKEWIDVVIGHATMGDYDHLVEVLSSNMTD